MCFCFVIFEFEGPLRKRYAAPEIRGRDFKQTHATRSCDFIDFIVVNDEITAELENIA